MILFRYMFLQLLTPYIISVLILTFVLSLNTINSLIGLIVTKGVPPLNVGLLLFYRLPQFLSVTMPLAMVVAVLVVVVRICMDLEFIAIRAAGISFRTILFPFFCFGLLLTGITLFMTLWAQPTGFAAFEVEQLKILESQTAKQIQPKVLSYDFPGKVLYVQDKDEEDNLSGVFIADQKLHQKSMVVMSNSGMVEVNEEKQEMVLKLSQGKIHLTDDEPQIYRTIAFDSFDYTFRLPSIIPTERGHIWGIPTWTLLQREEHSARVELLLRLTTPWACLGFAIAAFPLGISNPRSGRTGAYLRALMLVIVYYILWMGAKNLTYQDEFTPHVLWAPPLVILVTGIYGLYKFNYNLENILEVLHHIFTRKGKITR